jgi:hypothetical protein
MASNAIAPHWVPVHKAERLLGISREDLHRMRDDGTFKLGRHYGAGPLTRSRDSYYWNVPKCQKVLKQLQETPSVA